MTAEIGALDRAAALRRRMPGRSPDWRGAMPALRRLLDEPDATENAFAVLRALDPDSGERNLRKMLSHAEGRRLFDERPSLLAALTDRAQLARLPDGSFGRGYLEHIERYGLDPDKLVCMQRDGDACYADRDPGLRWYLERAMLMHDLWHVLTGLGADGAGEGLLLNFSQAQEGGRGLLLLALGAGSRIVLEDRRWPLRMWRAWWAGRRAVCLAALPYEELLPQPLEDVRRAVGIRSLGPELAALG